MINLKNILNKNFLSFFVFLTLLSSCSSMNITEESVYDGGIQTIEASVKENTSVNYETKAILANATVYFEFDSFKLSSKSIQTLRSAVTAMKENSSIKIIISGHADERGTREYNLA